MLDLDRSRARYVTRHSEGEVLERIERVTQLSLGFVLSNEQNFAQVCGWSGAAGCWAGRDANYEADFFFPRFGTLDMNNGTE